MAKEKFVPQSVQVPCLILRDYNGICNNCGAPVYINYVPAVVIGEDSLRWHLVMLNKLLYCRVCKIKTNLLFLWKPAYNVTHDFAHLKEASK